jgi:hypothetical protein
VSGRRRIEGPARWGGEGAWEAGEAGRRRGRPAAARPGEEGLEVGDDPDRWAPRVGDRVREGRKRAAGGVGPEELGRGGEKRKGKKEGGGLGRR